MAKKPPTSDDLGDIPHVRSEPRPDFSKPLAPKKLPKSIAETLEDDEKYYWTAIYDGTAGESTDSSVRYAAYASRIRTALLSAQRYVAYTSDIGESFRPVAHPYLVKGAYGISWAYLAGDVGYEGYKAYLRNQRILHPESASVIMGSDTAQNGDKSTQPLTNSLAAGIADGSVTQVAAGKVAPIEDYRAVMAQRAVFQSIASMGLPAFTIHSIVKYSGKALKNSANKSLRAYGPIGLGLAAVPALPFLFDEPVEKAVEYIFHKGFEIVGGPEAVAGRPLMGQKELRQAESQAGATKEKEL